MNFSNSKALIITIMSLVLAGSACLFSPEDGGSGGQSQYNSPVDTPTKLMENFLLSYQTKNIDAYMECLHEEFEFVLLEIDWEDYTGNGEIDESWGIDIEENMTGSMFSSSHAEVVDLTLDGNIESTWYGDSTLVTIQLVRSFDLKVYYYEDGAQKGFHALGDAYFLVKPNEDGDYQIWRWTDRSQT